MIASSEIATRPGLLASEASGFRYSGVVVYIFAYDVAYDIARQSVPELLGRPMEDFSVDASKRSPKQLFFHRAQMVRLPVCEREGPFGAVWVESTVKLFPIGAISITMRVPFAVERLEDLVAFHDLHFTTGALSQEARQLAEKVRQELASHFIRPVPQLVDEEAYTVFCIESPLVSEDGAAVGAEEWLRSNRRAVAALLTQEPDLSRLSEQEARESTVRYLSYYRNDLVVMDWDAALLVDEPRQFQETLYIIELANLQLAELEAYDRILDGAFERSYRDLRSTPIRKRGSVLNDLREIRIDLARFSDELSNITKFFGDWHLARIYENISARFHLADWHRSIHEKLKTLDNVYQVLQHDQTNRWMLMLEAAIVLLFIIDLVALFSGL
jgi:hypothetical protein